jgi:hypothetical protein
LSCRDEREARSQFGERYAVATGDVNDRIERSVIGAVWGANGYTTIDQADELGRQLDLAPGRRLLDVGTGRGWPGLYLAARTGCLLFGTDMPLGALALAARRARVEGIDDRVALVAPGGGVQPIRRGSLVAVVHTHGLC